MHEKAVNKSRGDASYKETYSDGPTVLPEKSFAFIVHPDGSSELSIPKWAEDEEVPEAIIAATMLAIKFMKDPEWVQQLIDEFKEEVN